MSLKHKSKACQIRNFMELAANNSFHNSLFNTTLFNVYVTGSSHQTIPRPPYYPQDFFDSIISAKDHGMDIINMTTKQWYNFLLDQDFAENGLNTHWIYKSQHANLESDWMTTWRNVRLPSFDSKLSSFAFKLVHNLLPCESRLADILPHSSPICKFSCPSEPPANYSHIFFSCINFSEVGDWILKFVRNEDNKAIDDNLLRLEVNENKALVHSLIPLNEYLAVLKPT